MGIAENVKALRVHHNLMQTELAKRVDTTQTMIAHIERGVKIPSVALLSSIAEELNCTIDYLVYGENNLPNH